MMYTDRQHHTHTERTPVRKTKGGPSWTGAPHPWSPTTMAPPPQLWQLQQPARTMGPTKPHVSKLFPSPPTQLSSHVGQEIPMRGVAVVASQSTAWSRTGAILVDVHQLRSPSVC
jgi:hypothetical protein